MPGIAANGQQLYHEIHGQGDALLCVMGLGGDVSGWAGVLPAWSERLSVVVFDNRDAGRSSYADSEYEVADMAADTIALADALGLERFHLLGMSLGGAIAQEMALALGDRVLSLTLCVSYAGGGRWLRDRARLEVAALDCRSEEALVDEMMLLTLSEETYEQASLIAYQRQLILSYPHRQRREGFVRQLLASSRHDASARLGSLTVPTHVIGAERDLLVPVWKSHQLAALIPHAKLTVIPGSGHALNVERPAELADAVLGFLP
jgi:3-oxoadipate enol-lactonase